MKLYKILNNLRRVYWFVARPKTTGVKCLIQNQNDEYLLIKTTYSGDYWTIPGGGVRHSESLEDAVIREVKEEVGITITDLKQIGSYMSEAEYKKDTVYLYTAKTFDTEYVLNKKEISEAQWFTKNSIPSNRSKALNMILSKL